MILLWPWVQKDKPSLRIWWQWVLKGLRLSVPCVQLSTTPIEPLSIFSAVFQKMRSRTQLLNNKAVKAVKAALSNSLQPHLRQTLRLPPQQLPMSPSICLKQQQPHHKVEVVVRLEVQVLAQELVLGLEQG